MYRNIIIDSYESKIKLYKKVKKCVYKVQTKLIINYNSLFQID